MAEVVFKNGFLSVGGTDLSDHVRQITLDTGRETVDPTAMGSNTRKTKASLKTWTVTIEFNQDYAASEVDEELSTIYDTDSAEAALVMRPDTGVKSATNPEWTGTGVLTSYTPMGGAVGSMHIAPATFEAASDLVRATS